MQFQRRVVDSAPPETAAGALPPAGPPDLWTSGRRGEARLEVSDVLKVRDGNRNLQKNVERLMNPPPGAAGFLVGSGIWEGRVMQRSYAYEMMRDTPIARVSTET